MGRYIQGPQFGKANFIITTYGGERLAEPPASFDAIPPGKALIVIVDNHGACDAAAFAYSDYEFRAFICNPTDRRTKEYVLIDYDKASEIAPFT